MAPSEPPYPPKILLWVSGTRAALCVVAVCALWLTSLQLCVALVDWTILTTTFTTVVGSCTFSYDVVQRENKAYARCVQEQLTACNTALTLAAVDEMGRVTAAQGHNAQVVAAWQAEQGNCSVAATAATGALTAWSALGVTYAVPYAANCSASSRQAVDAMLGHASSSARSGAFAASSAYAAAADSAATHLGAYAQAVNVYNAAYVANKTRALPGLSRAALVALVGPVQRGIDARFRRLAATVGDLLACVALADESPSAVAGQCPYPTTLAAEYASLQLYVNNTANAVHTHFQAVDAELVATGRSIAAAVAQANAFYDSVVGAQGVLAWVQANLGVNLCGKSVPDFCAFSKSDWFVPIPLRPSLPFLPRLPDPSALWGAVQAAPRQVQVAVANASSQTVRDMEGLAAAASSAVGSAASHALTDYHPPQYLYAPNTSAEVQAQKHQSEAFLSKVSAALSSVSDATVPTGTAGVVLGAARNASVTAAGGLGYLLSSFTTQWAALAPFAGVSVESWLASLATLQGALFLFDYLYRAAHTARLLYGLVRPCEVDLPAVDLGPAVGAAGGSKGLDRVCRTAASALGRVQVALELLPFIYVQSLMLLAFVAFCVWVLASVYVPVYERYVGGCVLHVTNDSLVSAQLSSLAFDFAATDGNSALAAGTQAYNARLAEYCSSYEGPSLAAYSGAVQAVAAANASLTADRAKLGMLTSCVNMTAADGMFALACCGSGHAYGGQAIVNAYARGVAVADGLAARCVGALAGAAGASRCPTEASSGRAYLPPGMYAQSPACAAGTTGLLARDSLLDSRFRCQALPPCETTCRGPDHALVHAVTKSCACMAEWLVNGNLLRAALAAAAYLLLNAARVLMVRGAPLLLWRALQPPAGRHFAVRLVAREDGEIVSAAVAESKTDHTGGAGGKDGAVSPATDGKVPYDDDLGLAAPADTERGRPEADAGNALGEVIARAVRAMLRGVARRGCLHMAAAAVCAGLVGVLLFYSRRDVAYAP